MQFKYLKYDLYRYFYHGRNPREIGLPAKVKLIILTQGIWATVVYRFSRWTLYECRQRWLRFLLKPLLPLFGLFIEVTTGIKIWTAADIGPGLYIGHFGSVLIGPVRIGKFCNVSQEISIGFAGRGDRYGAPEVGDFVYVGAGAKVIGKIRIGNHAAIGANAVVTRDVPDDAVVAGIPAKVISMKSSRDLILLSPEKFGEFLSEP